jgi:hypothetical protein
MALASGDLPEILGSYVVVGMFSSDVGDAGQSQS